MSEGHAFCSPSDWEGWSNCPGKPALEEFEPDSQSEAAAEGTRRHELAARLLLKLPVDEPIPAEVTAYVAAVSERMEVYRQAGAREVHMAVEQKLPLEAITGERDATGTADCVIIAVFADYTDMDVIDAKFGYRPVETYGNGQLRIYGLAAMVKHQLLHTFRQVNLCIFQPQVSGELQVWPQTADELYAFAPTVRTAAELSLSLRESVEALSHLKAGDKQCTFCKVKYRCPEFGKFVTRTVFGDFVDEREPVLTPEPIEPEGLDGGPELAELLSLRLSRVTMIEKWCLAVRAAVEAKLVAGEPIPGYKLVMGREGPREWSDAQAAENLLLADHQNPDKVYHPRELKSPPQIESAVGKKAPVWKALQNHIKRSEGKPSVAPADDPRPPFVPKTAEDFDSYDGVDIA